MINKQRKCKCGTVIREVNQEQCITCFGKNWSEEETQSRKEDIQRGLKW